MARYTAEQIYAFAREAGFSPDRAATMTAVALAESGGNSGAHNPRGEDSRGLWQINARAHPALGQGDLYDPVQNAKAAFAVSHGGDDISPWTTTHGGLSARYLRYRAQAEAAAAAYGDGPGRGMWSGTDGYGDHTAAGDARGGGPASTPSTSSAPAGSGSDNVNVAQTAGPRADPTVQAGEEFGIALDTGGAPDAIGGPTVHAGEEFGIALDGTTPAPATTPPVDAAAPRVDAPPPAVAPAQPAAGADATRMQQFLSTAVAQTGDQYVFGAETKLNDPNPSRFDCSELVEWASHQVGVTVPDGAYNQYTHLHKGGSTMSVEEAIRTPGALLFSFSSDPDTGHPKAAHVAISLGNGKTIEAKGTEYGVGSWDASTKRFQYAAMIPELGGPAVPTGPVSTQPPSGDGFSHRVNHDPVQMDNHPSTLAVSHELTGAAPPPAGPIPEPAPPPEPAQTLGDVDHDGMDDALQHATEFAAQADDHHLDTPGVDHVQHDFHDPAPHVP
jgi:cell wall-associated NlpC family hydrolase